MKLPTLTTLRLILRPFELSDAPEVQRLAGDWAIADTTLNIPHPYLDGMAETWINTHAEATRKAHSITLAITRQSDSALLGAISLMSISKRHQAELGYWIGKPYWGQGICTEAAQAVLAYAFNELALIRVYARHLARNPASGRVMQKLNMQYEGRLRQHSKKWEHYEDCVLYGLLKNEWQPVCHVSARH